MSSDCCLHQVIQSSLGFQLRLTLVAPATNVISEPYVCCRVFFHKSKFTYIHIVYHLVLTQKSFSKFRKKS